jgi:DnaK suppressor protein
MNIESLKHQLQAKERELLADVKRLGEEARESGGGEVRDPSDDATTSQGVSESLQEDTLASQTLIEVQDALQRIDDGTYGKCLTCGRQIEEARLKAIPWARYCLNDQEQFDKAAHVAQGGSTL